MQARYRRVLVSGCLGEINLLFGTFRKVKKRAAGKLLPTHVVIAEQQNKSCAIRQSLRRHHPLQDWLVCNKTTDHLVPELCSSPQTLPTIITPNP